MDDLIDFDIPELAERESEVLVAMMNRVEECPSGEQHWDVTETGLPTVAAMAALLPEGFNLRAAERDAAWAALMLMEKAAEERSLTLKTFLGRLRVQWVDDTGEIEDALINPDTGDLRTDDPDAFFAALDQPEDGEPEPTFEQAVEELVSHGDPSSTVDLSIDAGVVLITKDIPAFEPPAENVVRLWGKDDIEAAAAAGWAAIRAFRIAETGDRYCLPEWHNANIGDQQALRACLHNPEACALDEVLDLIDGRLLPVSRFLLAMRS